MNAFEVAAQAVGVVAMLFNVLSYQQKTSARIIGFQLLGATLFAVNFFMLGATMGGIMNVIAALRAVVFVNREKFRSDHIAWTAGFILLCVASYIITFAWFGKELTLFNCVIELLPVISMTAQTIAFRLQDAKLIRKSGFISSPCWLIYNIVSMSIGAIICESLNICSIVVGILRFDRKKQPQNKA